jgi:hypothetical protein
MVNNQDNKSLVIEWVLRAQDDEAFASAMKIKKYAISKIEN